MFFLPNYLTALAQNFIHETKYTFNLTLKVPIITAADNI